MQEVDKKPGIKDFTRQRVSPFVVDESVLNSIGAIKISDYSLHYSLGAPARRILDYIVQNQNCNKYLDLSYSSLRSHYIIKDETDVDSYFRRGIVELLEKEVIARSYEVGRYWLNRNFIWI